MRPLPGNYVRYSFQDGPENLWHVFSGMLPIGVEGKKHFRSAAGRLGETGIKRTIISSLMDIADNDGPRPFGLLSCAV
jgi:hypothetical protein